MGTAHVVTLKFKADKQSLELSKKLIEKTLELNPPNFGSSTTKGGGGAGQGLPVEDNVTKKLLKSTSLQVIALNQAVDLLGKIANATLTASPALQNQVDRIFEAQRTALEPLGVILAEAADGLVTASEDASLEFNREFFKLFPTPESRAGFAEAAQSAASILALGPAGGLFALFKSLENLAEAIDKLTRGDRVSPLTQSFGSDLRPIEIRQEINISDKTRSGLIHNISLVEAFKTVGGGGGGFR